MSKTDSKGIVSLPIVDASRLEKLLTKISNNQHLDEKQRSEAEKYSNLIARLSRAPARSKIRLSGKAILAILQCLFLATRLKKGLEKFLGDE